MEATYSRLGVYVHAPWRVVVRAARSRIAKQHRHDPALKQARKRFYCRNVWPAMPGISISSARSGSDVRSEPILHPPLHAIASPAGPAAGGTFACARSTGARADERAFRENIAALALTRRTEIDVLICKLTRQESAIAAFRRRHGIEPALGDREATACTMTIDG